ncbi:MAG: heme o synthase [Flavobacteriales bacterium]
MQDTETATITTAQTSFLRDVAMLFKLRLTLLVIISAVLSYYMGTSETNSATLAALCIGGLLLTGGSNGLNQALEREWDKLMIRTQNRPIPTGRMSVQVAVTISMIAGIAGIIILWYYCGTACGILGASAFVLYVALYTPLKRVSSLAVFVGAFPGAIPPMLGYVAATNDFGLEAGLLFAMQFMWQFPHFWAIAWVAHDDYLRGGYKLLPFNEGRSKKTAYQILLYSLFLIPVSLLPWALPLEAPMTGNIAAIITALAGVFMSYYAFRLVQSCDTADARKVMFASFFYLPVVQLAYVIDKIPS